MKVLVLVIRNDMITKYLSGILVVAFALASFSTVAAQGNRPDNPGNSSNSNNENKQNPGKSVEKKDLPPQAASVVIEGQGNSVKVQPKNDEGENITFEDEEINSFVIENLEEGEDDVAEDEDSIEVKSRGNAAVVIRRNLETKTNFPLQVNLETNELIVTTPKGQKVVTVLPDKAVQNMLAANVLDQIGGKGGLKWLEENQVATDSGDMSASDSGDIESSGSAETGEGDEEEPILLTSTEDGELVYEIDGEKFERLLGILPIGLQRKVIVSAETGELITVNQSIFTRLLDLLSF